MINKYLILKVMTILLLAVLLFHFSILFQFISYEVVWAGKIESLEEMRLFEGVSIFFNLTLLFVLFLKNKNLRDDKDNKVVNFVIWFFVVVFALNTIGNLFSKTLIELVLGTFLTLVSSVLCWLIVRR